MKSQRYRDALVASLSALETTICGKSDKFAILTVVVKIRSVVSDFSELVVGRKIGALPAKQV